MEKTYKELDRAGIFHYNFDGENFEKDTDYIFVIGGDGSILKIADRSACSGIPILGINTGRIGFLTETESIEGIKTAVNRLVDGDYIIDKRAMIEVQGEGGSFFALNEVAISRADNLNIVNITLKTNGDILEKYSGDGVLIATPTGSTAYSLSAGGPVLSPQVAALLVTPICPHTLHSRSIVVPDNSIIEVEAKLRGEGIIVVDGKKKIIFTNNTVVMIKKSKKHCAFVRFGGQSFYSRLLNKLAQWSDISFD
ncbi:MAG: NAD(+)/NADH kinase [Clostridia bacterium]|nr:NAD(+)/NADH kinase [Clostridia bacterium]